MYGSSLVTKLEVEVGVRRVRLQLTSGQKSFPSTDQLPLSVVMETTIDTNNSYRKIVFSGLKQVVCCVT